MTSPRDPQDRTLPITLPAPILADPSGPPQQAGARAPSFRGTKRQSLRISEPGPLLGVELSRVVTAGRDCGSSTLEPLRSLAGSQSHIAAPPAAAGYAIVEVGNAKDAGIANSLRTRSRMRRRVFITLIG